MADMTPTAVANQAIDAAGINFTLGDIEEGTREAQVCLRAYRQCLQQLLRAVHWNFARRSAPMLMLADATGQTPNVGSVVPTPWIYEYALPTDCMKARFVPWNPQGVNVVIPPGNIQISSAPQTTGSTQVLAGSRIKPARFLLGTDFNYPATIGTQWWETQGVSPQGRTVILTNVNNAQLVYTCFMMYPNMWDPQFRAALVAYLAAEIALPLNNDKKFGMAVRRDNLGIVKRKLLEARITDGNEVGFTNVDHTPDWLRARVSGGGRWGGDSEQGVLGYGYDACGFEGGSSASY